MSGQDRMSAAGSRPLAADETVAVGGGMKWTRGTKNPDVIDARGGSFTSLGITFTKDINGNISSWTPAN